MNFHLRNLIFFYAFSWASIGAQAQLRCENLFTSPSFKEQVDFAAEAESRVSLLSQVSNSLNEAKLNGVIAEFQSIYKNVIVGSATDEMSEGQFSQIYEGLSQLAGKYGIEIEHKADLIGVFPEGLRKVKISGFDTSTDNPAKPANFVKRHELGHLFHVLALRVILLDQVKELSPLSEQDLGKYIEIMEGGDNYLEFEKIVTDLSGALHVAFKSAATNSRYERKLTELMEGLVMALRAGRVHFSTGHSVIELYALFISKAPLVVGRSFAQMSARLSLFLFVEIYMINEGFRTTVLSLLGVLK